MQNKEIIYKLLQQKCDAISLRAPKGNHDFTGLVAFKDDLCFPLPETLSEASKLFDLAQKAIDARFRFARENHRLQRGESTEYACEYGITPEVDPQTNKATGDVVLVAQYVLREIPNPASSQSAESRPSPSDSQPSPESPRP